MNKKFGIGILIMCFGASSANLGLAAQDVDVSPVIVQPGNLDQQALDLDRLDRDQELAIQQLIEKNNQLTQSTLAQQEDQGLSQVNQTMLDYRNQLLARDRERIMENGEREQWTSRYGDLVKLTEDADAATVHRHLVEEDGLLADKYQMLSALKDEMSALNEKLSGQQQNGLSKNQNIIDGFEKITQQEQQKIQDLVAQLNDTDKKIEDLNNMLQQREQQIVELTSALSTAQNEISNKEQTILDQQNQIAALENQSKEASTTAGAIAALAPIVVNPQVGAPAAAEASTVTSAAPAVTPPAVSGALAAKDQMIKEMQAQLDSLTSLLADKNTQEVKQNAVIDQQHNEIALLKGQTNAPQTPEALAAKDETIKQMTAQVDSLRSQLADRETRERQQYSIIGQQQHQITLLKTQAQSHPQNTADNQLQDQVDLLKGELEHMVTQEKQDDKVIKQQEHQIVVLEARVHSTALPPIVVNPTVQPAAAQTSELAAKNQVIKLMHVQMGSLQSQLENKDTREKEQNQIIEQQQQQITLLKAQAAPKNQGVAVAPIIVNPPGSQQPTAVAPIIVNPTDKDQTVRWLKRVLAMAKDKAKYFQLTSQQDHLTIDQLNSQLSQLTSQLSQKQGQLDDLQSQVDHKNADDRLHLAKQLVGLQEEEASLLQEKDALEQFQNTLFDQHVLRYENRIKTFLSERHLRTADLRNRMEELNNDLTQKEAQLDGLQSELENKIAQEKDNTELASQIQDLQAQLKDKEDQIASMSARVQGQNTDEAYALRQQLAEEKDKVGVLKEELENKITESKNMTTVLREYQRKLESNNSAYNNQLGQELTFKNYEAASQKEIEELSLRLQQKEAQVVKARKDLYDLQESVAGQNRDLQAKDLTLSIEQQKEMDGKIKVYQDQINGWRSENDQQVEAIKNLKTQLALAQQQLAGMPSTDELDFLRAGLKKATVELQQKNAQLQQDNAVAVQSKADAQEYARKFQQESGQFQSLQEQLQDAQAQIQKKDEDLKYKDLAIARIEYLSRNNESGLKAQVRTLTQQLAAAQQAHLGFIHTSKEGLEAQLAEARAENKDLKGQMDQLESISRTDVAAAKLKQALDKIDEQGRIINVLAKKLQDCGQSVNLTKQ